MSIEMLNTLFYVFLVLTIMFFLIAILLFFVFDIRRIRMILSGKAEKLGVKKLQEESFKTGRLAKNNSANAIYNNTGAFGDSGKFGLSEEITKTEQMNVSPVSEPQVKVTIQYPEGEQPAPNLSEEATTVLGKDETTVLNNEYTTVLNAGETTVLGASGTLHGSRKFDIIKKDIFIHTEEVI